MTLSLDDPATELPFGDRRLYARLPIRRSAKLFDPLSRKYLPAVTIDASSGGAMIEVRGNLLSRPGQIVELAVDWTGDQPVLSRDEMQPARLVRFEPVDPFTGTQRIGLAFVWAAALSHAA